MGYSFEIITQEQAEEIAYQFSSSTISVMTLLALW
ncbi:hypothetical protein BRLA_c021560 [Brevibacillus laterosporus LMG 15441]|uniref:Uncharacterized protein n=1 Tax=Brevibacillus laterosporus LMG 15441 TaxID=1042163 RepID=A0A075R1K9_BRELA|nr:hypothetical protein BRLA_c021560 [Brevibacillus laterosporus LMG 15441]